MGCRTGDSGRWCHLLLGTGLRPPGGTAIIGDWILGRGEVK